MPLPDIFELVDVFLSWRLFLGLAATGLLFWLAIAFIPHETVAWGMAIPVGIVGVVLSIRWQHRAEFGK